MRAGTAFILIYLHPELTGVGLWFVIRDITEERILEIQRHQSQKLEAIGQLAAGIAHEINTPTQFIGNNLYFLANGFKDFTNLLQKYKQSIELLLSGERTQAEEIIEECKSEYDLDFLLQEIPLSIDGSLSGIDRVTRIVNAMKEFSHPGTHEKVITNINHSIDNTIIVTRNEWKYVADLTTDLDPSLPDIPCLVDEFNQVILNLIKNAAEAIREAKDAGKLPEMGKIEISTSCDGDWVTIQVSDNGPGIPASIRDRVFDPFFTTKEVGKGTGQGLSISYDVIVNKHGGKITFESSEEKGTIFTIKLPVAG